MENPEALKALADRLYTYIHRYLKDWARSPSQREMYNHLHCSPNTLQEVLDHLEASGRPIQRIRGYARRVWVPVCDMEVDEQ